MSELLKNLLSPGLAKQATDNFRLNPGEISGHHETAAQTERAEKHIRDNTVFVSTPVGQRDLRCGDARKSREETVYGPLRILGNDAGLVMAIVEYLGEATRLLKPAVLIQRIIQAKVNLGQNSEEAHVRIHTDTSHHNNPSGDGSIGCAHIDTFLTCQSNSQAVDFMKGFIELLRDQPDQQHIVSIVDQHESEHPHHPQGILLIINRDGGNVRTVHSQGEESDESYYVIDVSEARRYFHAIIPQLQIQRADGNKLDEHDIDHIFRIYLTQVYRTAGSILARHNDMPIYTVDYHWPAYKEDDKTSNKTHSRRGAQNHNPFHLAQLNVPDTADSFADTLLKR